MITYQRERAHDLWPEIEPLLWRNWEESGQPAVPLEPHRAAYNALEDAGCLRCYTARLEGARTLVGYAIFNVATNLHHASTPIAYQTVLYVAPEHRSTLAGLGLIDYSERHLRSAGAEWVYHEQKVKHPVLGRILARRNYEHIGNVWAKRLDDGGKHHG